jgi:HAE1 family hydrophobic/amphiphilic exporter-1
MALFVAVTVVPVLCSRLLRLPPPVEARTGALGRIYTLSERGLTLMDTTYARILGVALHHRPTVIGAAAAASIAAFLALPYIPSELMPQADEGEVRVTARLPPGSRIERLDAISRQIEEMVRGAVPEAEAILGSSGGGGFFGGGGASANIEVRLVPKAARDRSSEQVAQDLRAVLVGLPGVQITTRASGGNMTLNRVLGGNTESRLAVERRGFNLD